MNDECRIRMPRSDKGLLCSAFCLLSAVLSLVPVAGCQKQKANEDTALIVQMEQLTQQNEQLQEQVDQSKTENKELKERVQVLSGLPEDVRGENLYSLERITIGRLSGFFDKDKDGKREKMIVYMTPVDKQGDGIKATGAANVQLWDLNKADGEALTLPEADKYRRLSGWLARRGGIVRDLVKQFSRLDANDDRELAGDEYDAARDMLRAHFG